jgi:hypothetical protein
MRQVEPSVGYTCNGLGEPMSKPYGYPCPSWVGEHIGFMPYLVERI